MNRIEQIFWEHCSAMFFLIGFYRRNLLSPSKPSLERRVMERETWAGVLGMAGKVLPIGDDVALRVGGSSMASMAIIWVWESVWDNEIVWVCMSDNEYIIIHLNTVYLSIIKFLIYSTFNRDFRNIVLIVFLCLPMSSSLGSVEGHPCAHQSHACRREGNLSWEWPENPGTLRKGRRSPSKYFKILFIFLECSWWSS